MAVREILQLGNPALHLVSQDIHEQELGTMAEVAADLHDTMMAFRKQYGCGRAIAAPQIGVRKRLIYMHIDEPVVFINPVFDEQSDARIELWDDCMSFPELLVRVSRHESCVLRFRDLAWQEQAWQLDGDLSELLQHEYDHLDGILANQRAINAHSFALRSQRHLLPD